MRERGRGAGAWRLTAVSAVVGLVLTVLVTGLPQVYLAYRSIRAHLVLETVDACIGGLVGVLFYGRFRRSGRAQDLLLVDAMALLASSSFVFAVVTTLPGADQPRALTTWAPLLVRLAGGWLFALAAATRDRVLARVDVRRHFLLLLLFAVAVWLAALGLQHRLPTALDPTLTPEVSGRPRIAGHPAVIGAQAANCVLYAYATVAFTRHYAHSGDELTRWLGVAAAMSLFARVNYALFPSLYSQWLYTGDLLRSVFYVLLLVGAVREIQSYWAAQAEAASFAERQRLARDLHDGAVQELGYIRAQSARLTDDVVADQVRAAAERALDETRRAIASLTQPVDEPLAVTLARAAAEVGDRYDVAVRTDLDGIAPLPTEQREALVRIVREAVSNAARHGRASQVTVASSGGMLVVADDGVGFDVDRASGGHGFGLVAMRDRARGIGARLDIESGPSGTRVEVRLP